MIIVISGGVGSGKTLTEVKFAVEDTKNKKVLTNFTLKNIKNYHRLKKEDVLISDEKDKIVGVNWEYWNKNRDCTIYLDEMHNLISSRRAMSAQNQYMSEWISQIRKIFGNQGDQNHLELLRRMNNREFHKYINPIMKLSNNIVLVTQRTRKIDINFRDLCHVYIQCNKQEIRHNGKKIVVIYNNYWFGDDNNSAIEYAEMGVKPKTTFFIGNDYFKHYDSYELISTGGEYL